MDSRDECIAACRRLRELLEEDEREIGLCLQGELLTEYRKELQREICIIRSMEQKLLYI